MINGALGIKLYCINIYQQDFLFSCYHLFQGEGIPKPVMSFEEASMPEYVLKEVLKQGFSDPTPIQVL